MAPIGLQHAYILLPGLPKNDFVLFCLFAFWGGSGVLGETKIFFFAFWDFLAIFG